MSNDANLREWELAWSWLKHHETQRLSGFNFFLIIVGAFTVAYTQAVARCWRPFGVGIGVLGFGLTVSFRIIDIRNEELMWCGREVLKQLEEKNAFPFELYLRDLRREFLPKAIGTRPLGRALAKRVTNRQSQQLAAGFTHRIWLGWIYLLVATAFVAGSIWAALKFPGR